jgi:hypothetical protein
MDPTTATGAVILGVLTTVISAAVLGGLAWVVGPLKWLIRNRELRRLISHGRRFQFTFNPHTGQSKPLTFLPDGTVGEGRNDNERTWRVRRGRLELYAVDGKLYSRFAYDQASGYLRHTNEPGLRSIHGQYLRPSLVRVPSSGRR